MRVFVTGASGFVGTAVVRNLIDAGHRVLGLARSDAAAQALAAAGADVHRGDLEDRDSLQTGIAQAEGVIHTAFIHDFSNFRASCEIDRAVVETLGVALAGSGRPLVVTSGTGLLAGQGRVTEDSTPHASSPNPRIASEEAARAAAQAGAHVSLVRLPPSVHGDGDHGFIPMLIDIARKQGISAYIGNGLNQWPAVHRTDAAELFRLALEKGAANASYHATAEGGVAFKEIAAVIGKRLNLPVASVPPDQAEAHFGWFAHFAAMDNPSSSAGTRAALGWQPRGIGLIADLDRPAYFGG